MLTISINVACSIVPKDRPDITARNVSSHLHALPVVEFVGIDSVLMCVGFLSCAGVPMEPGIHKEISVNLRRGAVTRVAARDADIVVMPHPLNLFDSKTPTGRDSDIWQTGDGMQRAYSRAWHGICH